MRSETTTQPALSSPRTDGHTLPLGALLALATAVFVTSLTETLPAGVLPAMSGDLGVGESAMGQSVTIYAVGTALTAIPLSAATAGWPRKRLLLTAMAGFAAANIVTAASTAYSLTMAARFVAGVAAGLAWALLAGYARRLAPVHLQGKAIAIVMTGIPVALSLGVPAGTFLGDTLGWRVTFSLMTVVAVALIGWIAAVVPERTGRRETGREKTSHTDGADKQTEGQEREPQGGRPSMLRALRVPGVVPVLFVTLAFVLAHTILYTYVATFLAHLGMGGSTDLVLLVFGAASLVSIWVVGAHIDRRLRALTVASTLLVAVAATVLALLADGSAPVFVAAALWGLGWGGVPTLLQTAVADAGGDAADAAQAVLVTLWNAAMAGGGVAGGVLLDLFGPPSFPWAVLGLLLPVLAVVLVARTHGFPERGGAVQGLLAARAPLPARPAHRPASVKGPDSEGSASAGNAVRPLNTEP